jgi:hypothetical protein
MIFISKIILKFLTKYFFILKAASNGWRVKYIGGNKYEFYKSKKHIMSCSYFLSQYKPDFVNFNT